MARDDGTRELRSRVRTRIEEDFEAHVEHLLAMIRQPSVSATGEGIRETADGLVRRIEGLGADVRAESTARHPIVHGRLDVGAPRTVLFYMLYDVQPADDEGWLVPPFAPAVVDLPVHGPSVVGRGAFNSKGPLCGFLNVLEAFGAAGVPLPVNVEFLIEGEEEVGSTSLPAFVERHAEGLSRCDAVYQPYLGENSRGHTLAYLGCKGMMYLNLVCRGGDWGGPVGREIHALNSAWIANPAWRLAQALATLKDPTTDRVRVRGWYDQVRGPDESEEALVANLAAAFDPDALLEEQSTRRYKFGGPPNPDELIRAYLYEPTLNLDGLDAGYTGTGAKTVIPHEARANLDVRPVPDQDLDVLLGLIRRHLDEHGYEDIEIDTVTKVPWSQSATNAPAVDALREALEEHSPGPVLVWPRTAGMVPQHLFTRSLGLPVAFGGAGHGGRAHSTNEYVTIEGLRRHELANASFLFNFADAYERSPS